MVKILHMAAGKSRLQPDGLLAQEIRKLGELIIVEDGNRLTDAEALARLREADVLITMWGARPIPATLAQDPGRVRYILNVTGTCRPFIPIEIVRSGIPVTNWGDAPARTIAEGAMTLLLAVLKDLRGRIEAVAQGHSEGAERLGLPSGTLCGLRVGLYGCGVIGRRFVTLVRPFEPELLIYDPYAEIPEGCQRVRSLEELFEKSEVVVILAALTEETRGSVRAEHLARLPDHGIVINVARGDILDQEALFAELKSGRLRAGLDVLAGGDVLAPDHEARRWRNLIFTCHDIHSAYWPPRPPRLTEAEEIALDNLRRFLSGQPLRFRMDEQRYLRST